MEKKIIYLISLFVFLGLLITGCTQKIPQEQPPTTTTLVSNNTNSLQLVIKTGVSFGECMGYCQRDITINSEKIVFHKSGWNENGSLPEITEEVPISAEHGICYQIL